MTSEAMPAVASDLPADPIPADPIPEGIRAIAEAVDELRTARVTLAKHPALWAVCRTRFRAKRLADLQSGDMDRVLDALGGIVLEHNLPDAEEPDQVAAGIGDVDYLLLGEVAQALTVELKQLPNR